MASTLASGSFEDLDMDIDALLREHQQQRNSRVPLERPRGFDIHRSGSAPPTVEGSVGARGSLLGNPDMGDAGGPLTEEEIRSHPAYLAYYYSTDNLNPRLPPPMLSREDWRSAQMLQSGAPSFGGIGDQRKRAMNVGDGSSSSLLSLQPGVSVPEQEGQSTELLRTGQRNMAHRASAEWVERGRDGLTGLTGIGLGARRKSFADALKEEMNHSTTLSGHPPRSVSRNGLNNGASDELMELQNSLETGIMHTGAASSGLVRVQSFGSSVSQSLATGLGPLLVRSTTPDPQLMRRSSSSCLPPIAGRGEFSSNGMSSRIHDNGDIAAALAGMNLSKTRLVSEENRADNPLRNELADQSEFLFNMHKNVNKSESELLSIPSVPMMAYKDLLKKTGLPDHTISKLYANGQGHLPKRSSFSGISTKMPPLGSAALEGSSSPYRKTELPNIDFAGTNMKGLTVNQRLPERLNNQIAAGAAFGSGIGEQYLSRSGSPGGSGLQASHVDPLYAQYLQQTDLAAQTASTLNDSALRRNYAETSILDMPAYQNAYVEALIAQQKLQYGMPFLGKTVGYDQGHYTSAAYGLGMPYPPGSVTNSILSSMGPGNSLRQNERFSRFPSVGRNITGALGSWMPENDIKETGFTSSFLEEFKNNKTKNYELSDIVDHAVEFSADQFGSRFIQQKLETASVEEKNKIFPEILPHARALMTDVFGNYVIQKFFEHGTEDQRIQLACQLKGHVLALSLQMYGCRVIQKALEVVDVDQQTQMVSELDGSIMKCVRDQNGNHVIQKCIECVPQEKIQFIISTFYGQVVALSTHPYGCRVIQRVLEHCDDVKTQTIVMAEILQSVFTLAQDQYGNYVVQHVLQHGKPEERSAIISTLAGQIVKMSQQKFASNVVEKCLTFGSPDERQLLINEMLGSTDENEPLQAMMKDQFGNYVVQKVLETCDDQNRELILSRIKVHLNALKRYTYGKHIVARVEKLVTAGERRIGMSSCS